METLPTNHYVILDRDDEHGAQWKLLTETSRRPASLDDVGMFSADEWVEVIGWITTALDDVIVPRHLPAPLVHRVHTVTKEI